MNSHKLFIAFAAFLGLVAITIASLGAHTVNNELTVEALQRLDTGLKYQFYHVAALLCVGVLSSLHRNNNSVRLKISGTAFILGILLFSGSLYAYAVTGNEIFGKITPFGGISFIIGWLFLFFFSFRK